MVNSGHTFHEPKFKASNVNHCSKLGDNAVFRFSPQQDGDTEMRVFADVFDSRWRLPVALRSHCRRGGRVWNCSQKPGGVAGSGVKRMVPMRDGIRAIRTRWDCSGMESRRHRCNFNEPGHAHELTFRCYRRFPFFKAERTCPWLAGAVAHWWS